ncbi:MAG: hypothetical protein HRT57_06575 [Crocinitomicaceae bacterium]|nr:hypothetical protein [Crocinitomicaceae bacterium]
MFFPELNPDSKVWVYTADRDFDATEVNFINDSLAIFIPQWAAHGAKLIGNGIVHKSRFLILSVDESQVNASGCSIDTSVQFVKNLGSELDVDFFNRMNVVIENDGVMDTVHFSDLKSHMNSKVYNPMITKLSELNSSWLIPVEESPFV